MKPWLTSEVDVIRAHYKAEGVAGCAARLPGRTPAAIYKRARLSGFSNVHGVRVLAGSALNHLRSADVVDRKMLAVTISRLMREALRK